MFPKFRTRTYVLTSLLTILAVSIVIFFVTLPEKNTPEEVWADSEEILEDIFNEFPSYDHLAEVRARDPEEYSGPCGELSRGTQIYAGVRYEITNPDDMADEILLELDSILTDKGFDSESSTISIERAVEIIRENDSGNTSNISYENSESGFIVRVSNYGLDQPLSIAAVSGCFRVLLPLAQG